MCACVCRWKGVEREENEVKAERCRSSLDMTTGAVKIVFHIQ